MSNIPYDLNFMKNYIYRANNTPTQDSNNTIDGATIIRSSEQLTCSSVNEINPQQPINPNVINYISAYKAEDVIANITTHKYNANFDAAIRDAENLKKEARTLERETRSLEIKLEADGCLYYYKYQGDKLYSKPPKGIIKNFNISDIIFINYLDNKDENFLKITVNNSEYKLKIINLDTNRFSRFLTKNGFELTVTKDYRAEVLENVIAFLINKGKEKQENIFFYTGLHKTEEGWIPFYPAKSLVFTHNQRDFNIFSLLELLTFYNPLLSEYKINNPLILTLVCNSEEILFCANHLKSVGGKICCTKKYEEIIKTIEKSHGIVAFKCRSEQHVELAELLSNSLSETNNPNCFPIIVCDDNLKQSSDCCFYLECPPTPGLDFVDYVDTTMDCKNILNQFLSQESDDITIINYMKAALYFTRLDNSYISELINSLIEFDNDIKDCPHFIKKCKDKLSNYISEEIQSCEPSIIIKDDSYFIKTEDFNRLYLHPRTVARKLNSLGIIISSSSRTVGRYTFTSEGQSFTWTGYYISKRQLSF